MFQVQEINVVSICITVERTDFLCPNGVKIYQLKAKSFEIKPYSLCVANISACFNPNQDELFPAAHR